MTLEDILNKFVAKYYDKGTPSGLNQNFLHRKAMADDIQSFIRSEITSLLESLKREKKPFIKGIAYTTENNVNSGYNQRCTEINEDINKILGKDN